MSNSKNLCLECGLCCDGSLFTNATMGEDEVIDPSIRAGFEIIRVDGKKAFSLPCVYQHNRKCTKYSELRPDICKSFKCILLKQYSSNVISWDNALQILQSTFNHIDRLEKELKQVQHLYDQNSSLMARCNSITSSDEYKEDPILFRKNHASLMLESVAYSVRIEKYFKKKSAKKTG